MSVNNNENKNVDRFQFVTMDELDNSFDNISQEEDSFNNSFENNTNESIQDSYQNDTSENDSSMEESTLDDEKEVSEDNTNHEDKPLEKESNTENHTTNKIVKKHLSFEVRIAIMIICVLCMFIGACLLILETVRNSEQEVVNFKETSSVQYNVCMLANQRYNTSCVEEGLEYDASLVDTINAHFEYGVNFSSDISYNMYYHVDAVTKIYDKDDVNKIFYTSTDTVKDKVALGDVNNYISFNTDVVLDYSKFNKGAVFYQNRYFLNSKADLEIILYLDEPDNSRKIASLIVPLGTPNFMIQKNVVSNTNGTVAVDGNFWNHYNAICALIASILIVVALFLLYRTAILVLRVTSNRSEYQQRLDDILREYDRIIVIARNGYESNYVKEVVKLDTFDELLEIRNELIKPIIYSRINEVKSEFLVEDDEKLYKYVIKETDLYE